MSESSESLFDPKALPATRYQNHTPWPPLLIAAILIVSWFALSGSVSPEREVTSGDALGPLSDVQLYQYIVSELRSGVPYYDAVGDGLRTGDFPRWPVFNWRPPLVMTLLSWIPPWLGFGIVLGTLLSGLYVLRSAIWSSVDWRFGWLALFCVGYSSIGWVTGYSVWFTEAWAGAFLFLALGLCGAERGLWGALFGTVAVCCRELAGFGVLVLGVDAILRKRWKEAAAWVTGGTITLIYYGMHWRFVAEAATVADREVIRSWVSISGSHFILGTIKMTGFGTLLPASVVMALSVIGLWGATGRIAVLCRWVALVYGVFFFLAGHHYNLYWGFLWAPVIGWGVAWAPACIRDLWHRPRGAA